MRVFLKAVLIFLGVISFIITLVLAQIIFIFARRMRARVITFMLHIFTKILVCILGIRIEVSGDSVQGRQEGVFFVSNHLSYLDGFITNSIFPFIFIGKSELKNWPLLGLMIGLSDTIFVNRANYFSIQKEIDKIKFMLNSNINVILFPEGTSSDGRIQSPFKSSFFAAPLESKCKIVPLAIKYKRLNGQDINEDNKDSVYWYGDMEFFPHFMGVLKLKTIEVKVRVGRALDVAGRSDRTPSLNRKYLSGLSQEAVHQNLLEEKVPAQ